METSPVVDKVLQLGFKAKPLLEAREFTVWKFNSTSETDNPDRHSCFLS